MRLHAVAALLLVAVAPAASAGVFTDDLSRCLVEKTSEPDRTALMRWMFAALTRDPALADLSQVSQEKRDTINKTAADLYGRLIFADCRAQAIAALRNEGLESLGESGRVLGAAASRRLMSSPAGHAELNRFADLTDKKKWQELALEAGIQVDRK